MKWQIKKSLAQENVGRYMTDGGSNVIYVDEKLVKMFGNGAVSLMISSGITHWFYVRPTLISPIDRCYCSHSSYDDIRTRT